MYGFLSNLNKNHDPRELSFKHRAKPTDIKAEAYRQECTGGWAATASQFQSDIQSVHFYPFVVAIEKTEAPVKEFVGAKHGTQGPPWNP